MLSSHLARSAASARILLDVAAEYGLDPDDALRGTTLTAEDLQDPSREILTSQEQRLIENIVAAVGQDSGFAFDAGTRYSLDRFGMIGFAFMSSATLRETVELSLRYQDLAFTLARCELVREEAMTYIRFDVSDLPDRIHRFVVDLSMTTIWRGMAELGGKPPTAQIHLSYPRPEGRVRHLDAFGIQPVFGAHADLLGFTDSYLDGPRRAVDAQTLELCEQQCRVLLARRHAAVGAAGMVSERLSRAWNAVPTMEMIASDLNTSVRSLRRSLEAEGTSFRQLDEDARRTRAEELLTNTDLAMEQIAYRLGYATPSAFNRAFRRWHQVTPGLWRNIAHETAPRR